MPNIDCIFQSSNRENACQQQQRRKEQAPPEQQQPDMLAAVSETIARISNFRMAQLSGKT
jgi:hypothetical protein